MTMRPGVRTACLAAGCVVLLLLSVTKGWADLLTLPITVALLPSFIVLSSLTRHAIAAHPDSRWCRAALRVPQVGSIAALVCIDVFYPGFGDTHVVVIAGFYQTGDDGPVVEVATAISTAAFTVGLIAGLAWLLALLICAGRRSAATVSPGAPTR